MPYENVKALPERLRQSMPLLAQEIYREAFNAAWRYYADLPGHEHPAALEEAVSRSAWAELRRQYRQDETTRRWRPVASGT